MSDLILPSGYAPRHAQLHTKIVFYQWKSGYLTMGAPESYPAPRGAVKIVCNTSHEAEIWSDRMRQQEKIHEQRTEEEREEYEAPLRAYARGELQRLMANARNELNREFCRRMLQKLDEDVARKKWKRESYLHSEAFEEGD
jgi:hypothetical protein